MFNVPFAFLSVPGRRWQAAIQQAGHGMTGFQQLWGDVSVCVFWAGRILPTYSLRNKPGLPFYPQQIFFFFLNCNFEKQLWWDPTIF